MFECYLNKPEATKETFDENGWFKTGDIVSVDSEGYYKILGRNSVDIIKSGGYKLSALEIETEILSHPQVAEVSVCVMSIYICLLNSFLTYVVLTQQFYSLLLLRSLCWERKMTRSAKALLRSLH